MHLKSQILLIALILLGFAGVFFIGGFTEKNRPPMPDGYKDEDLVIEGSKLKDFSLGLNGMMADWYWMRSLQYLGGKFADNPDLNINGNDLRELNPRLLYPFLDNAVKFDPQFLGVYQYGAVVLPAVDTNLAVKFVEDGIQNNPNEWQLYNQLGYIYWKAGEFEKAADAYEKASKIEGASSLMKTMVARMKTDAGSRDTARSIYTEMHDSAQDDKTKETAEFFLNGLDALDEIEAVNSVLKEHRLLTNVCVDNFADIIPMLSNVKLPNGKDFRVNKEKILVDPSGAPYFLDSQNCLMNLDKEKSKLRID